MVGGLSQGTAVTAQVVVTEEDSGALTLPRPARTRVLALRCRARPRTTLVCSAARPVGELRASGLSTRAGRGVGAHAYHHWTNG